MSGDGGFMKSADLKARVLRLETELADTAKKLVSAEAEIDRLSARSGVCRCGSSECPDRLAFMAEERGP